jgi:UDP-N-acetylglucosamine 2-epimerase (non-hydrolysing)
LPVKIAVVVGTRQEIVKMAPVVRACQARDVPCVLLHTGQHYSDELDRVFFQELGLPQPHRNLEVGSGPERRTTFSAARTSPRPASD